MNYSEKIKIFIASIIDGREKEIRRMVSDGVIFKVNHICGTGKDDAVKMGLIKSGYAASAEILCANLDVIEFTNEELREVILIGTLKVVFRTKGIEKSSTVQLDISFLDSLIIRFNIMCNALIRQKHVGRVDDDRENSLVFINEDDIAAISVIDHRLCYHCTDGNVYESNTRKTLADAAGILSDAFVLANRYNLINISKVEKIVEDKRSVILPNLTIKVSARRFNDIKKLIVERHSGRESGIEAIGYPLYKFG